ncbi:hypothetical protein ABH909_000113 [Pseudomonas sp. BS3782 TE3695]|uniref:NEL-type E3 ubiquitin ligase domain-containing protein n=1 Tax=Pseudomonas sp. BS3782 TE3695 TaxID=3349323 RepID=UPI003D19AB1F
MTQQDLVAGELPERVVDFLDEKALREVIGQWLSGERQARIDAIRALLAKEASKSGRRLFDNLNALRERTDNPSVRLLKRDYPQLTTGMAEDLLQHAQPSDLQHLSEKPRVPLTLAQQAREAERQVRLARAYEGLYLDELHTVDSDRLALHTLKTLPGWSTDLRLELREYSAQGTLLGSIGAQSASERKVLVIRPDGKYQARDGLDQQLHGDDSFYAAMLHALPDRARVDLGFQIHDDARLEQTIKAHPLSRDRLAPILLENPALKPAYDPAVMRLRGGMQGYAQQVPRGMGLRRRVQSLYPGFAPEQVETLLTRFTDNGGSVHQRLNVLETEFNQLNRALRHWVESPTASFRFSKAGRLEVQARERLYKAIRQCWQRTGPAGVEAPGVVLPQALNLDNFPMLRQHLTSLPELQANFDHVTSLNLRAGELGDEQMPFLKSFRRVRYLNLQDNLLTTVPPAVSDMPHLTNLFLNDNRIELDAEAVGRLKNLTRLQSLGLRNNPLKLVPDISRMPRLQILLLNGTSLDSWPIGLFAQPRPRNIFLDLRQNRISVIPKVAPGSFRAELLARTLLSREPEWIEVQDLETLKMYIESVGLDPEREYPPRGTVDSADWYAGLTERQWQLKQQAWDEVEDEFDSLKFFDEIRKLTMSADFKAGGAYQVDLTAKVWRMIEAMARDGDLRVRLFNEAIAPTQCVDGGTQLFNAMGMQVLIQEAYALQRADLIEAQLLELALGKSRLDELGAIARHAIVARVAAGERLLGLDDLGNVTGTVDEVEVHLAYMTDLAERLDLPWQARGMQFRTIAGVSKAMIDAAFERIVALEEADLLAERILDQPLWRTWLESENREEIDVLTRPIDALSELQDALHRRGQTVDLEAKAALEEQVQTLCGELDRDENEFANGRLLSDDAYAQALKDIDQQIRQRLLTLTRQAMERTGLQRLGISPGQ